MTTILFFMGFSKTEMDFDKYYTHCKEIVELAKEVVVDEELLLAQERCGDLNTCRHRDNANSTHHHFPGLTSHHPGAYHEDFLHIKASFALDLGIVPPLFVVATWDSILSGRVAQWIMEIEEEDLSPYEGPWGRAAMETVPDEKRVMVKEILFDMQRREATLRCGTRGAREEDYDERMRVNHICW
jgi:hypothetical protein